MKISELPQATAVTGEDVAVIVQGGVTKQVPRSVLAPDAPDDLLLTDRLLQLGVGGTAIGDGVKLPDEKWKKIADVTLEEQSSSVVITKDTEGQAFDLKKCLVIFAGKYTGDGYMALKPSNSTSTYLAYTKCVASGDKNDLQVFYVEKIAPAAYLCLSNIISDSRYSVQSVSSISPLRTYPQGMKESNAIVSFTSFENYTPGNEDNLTGINFARIPSTPDIELAAGSRILVYGVQDTDS